MSIRLIALDVDGTLAHRDHEVSARNCEAIARAAKKGIHVVLATGRRHRTARLVADRLSPPTPIVCLGGALVKDHQDNTLGSSSFPARHLEQVVALARDHEQAVILQLDPQSNRGCDFYIDDVPAWNHHLRRYHDEHATYARGLDVRSHGEHRNEVLVVSLFGDTQELRHLASDIDSQLAHLTTVLVEDAERGGAYLEVAQREVTKWTGLLRLAEHLGVAADEIAAVGDQLNDLPMLAQASTSVAMGNAHPDVIAAAKWTTARHDEDGVALAIDRILDA